MKPDQLTADQKALIRGTADRKRNGGIVQSNIAALHFDGPWLAECLYLAREIEAVNIRNLPPKVS